MKEVKKQESSFERKLKEIEREKRRIEHDIKSLSKAMKRGELPPPPTPPRAAPSPGPRPTTGQPAPKDSAGEWGAMHKEKEAGHTSEEAHRAPLGSPLVPEKKMPVYGDERFTNYFSAGGFKSPMPARQERSIQRNKAVFMVVLVIIIGYIIFTVFVR